MNKITINYELCSPPPSGGYLIYYKVVESGDSYKLAGRFFSTPAVFYDTLNLAGTCYEGYVVSDCGNGVFGNQVPFQTCGSGVPQPVTIIDHNVCTPGFRDTSFKIKGPVGTVVEVSILMTGVINYSIASSHATVTAVCIINPPINDGSANIGMIWNVSDLTGNTGFSLSSPSTLFFTIPVGGLIDIAIDCNLENGGTLVSATFKIVTVNGNASDITTNICAGYSTGT